MNYKLLINIGFLCCFLSINAQKEFFQAKTYIVNKDTLQYRVLYPKNFSKDKQYPLVLFLHGAGERGHDNKSQLVHGSKLFLDNINRDSFPAIVIFPQCPKGDYWPNATVDRSTQPVSLKYSLDAPPTKSLNLVMKLLEEYQKKQYVNNNKIYVGGLSMGGMGTFEILYRKPNTFAAAFAICGGGNPGGAKAYAKNTKLWIFHGAKDDVVSPQLSLKMASAYIEAGGAPNVTIYANSNHNSWDAAFAEPNLIPWLFSNQKE